MASKPPELIKLRLPAAILSSLSKDSRVSISHVENKDDRLKSSLFVAKSKNDNLAEEHPLQIQNNHVEWYQKTENEDLRRIGKTDHQYTVGPTQKQTKKLDTSTVNLKRIGAQTRKLLNEERKKRKEIVCLKDGDLPPPPDALPGRAARTPNTTADASLEKEKKAVTKQPAKKRVTKRKRNDPTIDSWMPNTEYLISRATGKEDRSNIIRLHGLPIGVEQGDIRKFFHGLNPFIFVLPTFNAHIEGCDAKVDDLSSLQKRKNAIERYPESFRVYVKFQSVLVADAAMERLGESIGVGSTQCKGRGKGVVGAAISLSPVSKVVATFLQKNLGISSRKCQPIAETLAAVEKRIGGVKDFAWIMAAKKLKLDFSKTQHGSAHLRLCKLFRQHDFIPKKLSDYNSLVKVYNQLIDEHEKMEVEIGLLLMHTFDPSCLEDSAHRITQSTSNWLLDEIKMLESNLHEGRQSIKNC